MLSARLLAYQTLLLIESGNGDPEEASSLLVEAESYLIGHRLWDLEGLVRDLRRRIGDVLPRAPGVPGDQGTRSASSFKLVARSSVMKSVVSLIQRVASTSRPILITGETGAGKEVIARAIHEESRRSSGPFVSINCAAVPADLLEAELFGYRSGAFTGAERDRAGLLVSARSGTFLFDEIGEMPLTLQGKLLRLLDHARVRPLGGEEEVEIDVRYLFSTNRDLRARVEEGLFRRDLFFRLSALEVTVPPLRERLEDLPDLVRHFESKMAGGPQGGWLGGPQSGWSGGSKFDVGALRAFGSHSWPGNVRELENVMARLVLTCPNSADTVSAEAVRLALGKARSDGVFPSVLLRSRTLDQLQRQLEKDYLIQLHADRGRDLKAMAAELGITRRALYKRFKVLGVRHQDL